MTTRCCRCDQFAVLLYSPCLISTLGRTLCETPPVFYSRKGLNECRSSTPPCIQSPARITMAFFLVAVLSDLAATNRTDQDQLRPGTDEIRLDHIYTSHGIPSLPQPIRIPPIIAHLGSQRESKGGTTSAECGMDAVWEGGELLRSGSRRGAPLFNCPVYAIRSFQEGRSNGIDFFQCFDGTGKLRDAKGDRQQAGCRLSAFHASAGTGIPKAGHPTRIARARALELMLLQVDVGFLLEVYKSAWRKKDSEKNEERRTKNEERRTKNEERRTKNEERREKILGRSPISAGRNAARARKCYVDKLHDEDADKVADIGGAERSLGR
ncbi:hypothetical protein DFH06DRAFT_1304597 [Mycena polygramma]|nr:hypothetical protein DFH06DRAFT_1304597 [Mycena polygramma]